MNGLVAIILLPVFITITSVVTSVVVSNLLAWHSAVLPESCRTHLRRDLAAVPVLDAPTVTTVIAWPPHSRSRALAGLVRAATRL